MYFLYMNDIDVYRLYIECNYEVYIDVIPIWPICEY